MKTSTLRWMIAAAALVVAGGSASAQTYKAEIPMAFRVGNKLMAPGDYSIRADAFSTPKVLLHNGTDNTAALLGASYQTDVPKNWREDGSARVIFECSDGNCRIKSLWDGSNPYVQNFATPRHSGGPLIASRPEIVTLTMIKVR